MADKEYANSQNSASLNSSQADTNNNSTNTTPASSPEFDDESVNNDDQASKSDNVSSPTTVKDQPPNELEQRRILELQPYVNHARLIHYHEACIGQINTEIKEITVAETILQNNIQATKIDQFNIVKKI